MGQSHSQYRDLVRRRDITQLNLDRVYLQPSDSRRPVDEEIKLREYQAKYLKRELNKLNEEIQEYKKKH